MSKVQQSPIAVQTETCHYEGQDTYLALNLASKLEHLEQSKKNTTIKFVVANPSSGHKEVSISAKTLVKHLKEQHLAALSKILGHTPSLSEVKDLTAKLSSNSDSVLSNIVVDMRVNQVVSAHVCVPALDLSYAKAVPSADPQTARAQVLAQHVHAAHT